MAEITKTDFMPRYYAVASVYSCAKYSLISCAAYTHFLVTGSPESRDVSIRYTCSALQELQEEINKHGPENMDAILVASVGLASSAQDW